MEDKDLLSRKASFEDKGTIKLFLTDKGMTHWLEIKDALPEMDILNLDIKNALTGLLRHVQAGQNHRGFAVCHTCRYHHFIDRSHFQCGLTGENLHSEESVKIFREHEYA